VLDPAVKGSLTIVLDDVPWDQALDIVLQNNSLGQTIERQRFAYCDAFDSSRQKPKRSATSKGTGRSGCPGDRHTCPQLFQGGDHVGNAEEVPQRAWRYSVR